MSLSESSIGRFRRETNDEIRLVDPDAHVAIEKKGDAAEHLLLDEPFAPAQ